MTLIDLLVATVAANERSLSAALAALLKESERYAAVLEQTADAISRQDLAKATGISTTNLSKVTQPLIRAGWLKAVNGPDGLVLRRSVVVDALLLGRDMQKWRADVRRRLGTIA